MLHNIAVRTFLEQPAGKDAVHFLTLAGAHIQLYKRTGFLAIFPGRGGFACPQPDNHIANTQRLAGLQPQIARFTIAFVKQADDSNTVTHWCCTGL